MSKLRTKPGRDPDRRDHQAQVKNAILEGPAWGLVYLLARVKDWQPYENYVVPESLEVFEFTLKGVLRLEMMNDPGYRGWRRMFGSNTKARTMSTWRSRVAVKAFENLAGARRYVAGDPLFSWGETPFSLPANLPPDDWYVVFQVQDVWLPGSQYTWADLFEVFLKQDSALFEGVARWNVLAPLKGGGS
jgi:hypothetical protein